jgi:dihydroorotate dehydrogenase electron transfer subunit
MKHVQAIVSERRALGPALWEIWCAAPGLSDFQPGQFFLLAGPTYLRRALFAARCDAESLSFLVKGAPDPFTAWLVSRAPGDTLDLLGPSGRGFAPPRRGARWLLVAETAADVGPLWRQLDLALAAGAEVILLTGATHAAAIFPPGALPVAVEVRVATVDGSWGKHGSVAGLLSDALPWADRVGASGSRALYRALQREVQAVRPGLTGDSVEVLLADVPLVCGLGACLACAIHSERRVHLACQDGLVFDLSTCLAFEEPGGTSDD